jgi:metal-responsive CopG/Arc/MetJ family transcriptional regulator
MAATEVTLPADLEAELDDMVVASGRPRDEIIVEALARFLLEERSAIDRIVEARFREFERQDPSPHRRRPSRPA